ncbi:hypothetical protein F5884DRAFT_755976 [Xylogone sp. PMI_703]|nr:hypothetical protein F5884DRAFT_755976 [Xylogone sp. PMI_703]
MKSTSPLSLLLFLHLANSAPIALSGGISEECVRGSCQRILIEQDQGYITAPEPSKAQPEPHSPASPLVTLEDGTDEEEMWFDNRPITPPSTMSPEEALALDVPLSADYLRSLALGVEANTEAHHMPQPIHTGMTYTRYPNPTITDLVTSLKDDIVSYIEHLLSSSKQTLPKTPLSKAAVTPTTSTDISIPPTSGDLRRERDDVQLSNLPMDDVYFSYTYVFPKEMRSRNPTGKVDDEASGQDSADLLVVLLVLAFLCVLVGTEFASRMKER